MLVIDGAGDGHGVGMSQVGAEGLAEHGYNYQQILAHYYTGTAITTLPGTPTVSILLASRRPTVSFAGATAAGTRRLDASADYRALAAAGGEIALESPRGHRQLASSPLLLSGSGPVTLLGKTSGGVKNGSFAGALELVRDGGGIDVVNVLDLEDYVRGVVPFESSPSWQPAELEAQAVAARSYALTSHESSEFDLYGDTRSQAYGGVGAETPSTNAAVAATAGQVVTYDGTPVPTYYFASSGGETEDIQNSFIGAAAEPWLVAVADPYDDSRFGPITITVAKAEHDLGRLLDGTLTAIDVTQRGASPRIVSAQVVGSGGSTTVSGPQLEAAFGLPSAWACFDVTGASGTPPAGWDAACATPAQPAPSGPTGQSGPT
jgi:stage II sporulation protein D